jgi:hypothetical protein
MSALLVFHVFAGSAALVSAGAALVLKKGGQLHRRAGRAFFYSMVVIFLTAVVMAMQTSNTFLFLVALFSFYLAFSGWRFARNQSGEPQWMDWLAVIIMVSSGLLMWFLAFQDFPQFNDTSVTLSVFGFIALVLGFADARCHRDRAATGNIRIAKHLTNMLGGTIAVMTAVLVVNVSLTPPWLGWILPTILMLPVIIWWSRKVKA